MFHDDPTATTIVTVFTEGVQAHSGKVTETIVDGHRLFARSLLPFIEEVRPKDRLQGGLALRATESEIWLHPYLFRQVCSNGAILAHSIESRRVEHSDFATEDEVVAALREAISACCEQDVFINGLETVRTSVNATVDLALTMAAMLAGPGRTVPPQVLDLIFKRFHADRDPSRFSLMNAVTSVARDTRDPELRWRLEELGGGIGAGIVAPKQPLGGRQLHRPRHELTAVE